MFFGTAASRAVSIFSALAKRFSGFKVRAFLRNLVKAKLVFSRR
jgi:hypothetical protein